MFSKFIIIIIYSFESFSHPRELIVSHRSLSDSKSPQVSRTLLSISKSYSLLINPLVTVLSAPITIGIIVTFMFYIIIFLLLESFFLHR